MNLVAEVDRFEPSEFFRDYWRTKPMVVRGGANEFLGRQWSEADFDAAYAQLKERGAGANERAGEVTFIERISDFDSDLATRLARFGQLFAAPTVWFDCVRTYTASGIGAHFDHSDNFVLQQSGTKDWSLASSAHLTEEQIARRMLNDPQVGTHQLPDEATVRVTLRPGDLLYIPLLWLHSGVSGSSSLSLSLVCPAMSLYSVVAPFVGPVLKKLALGYQPVPALHPYLTQGERRDAVSELERATRALLERLAGDEVVRLLHALQARHLPGADAPAG